MTKVQTIKEMQAECDRLAMALGYAMLSQEPTDGIWGELEDAANALAERLNDEDSND